MFDNYNKALKNLIQGLIRNEETVDINFNAHLQAFAEDGIEYNLGGGKTVEVIERGTDHIILKCKMTKGDYYSPNIKTDATEKLTVISGKIVDYTFNLEKSSMGTMSWQAGTPREIRCLEDALFYTRIERV